MLSKSQITKVFFLALFVLTTTSCGDASLDGQTTHGNQSADNTYSTGSKVINGASVPDGGFPDVVELQTFSSSQTMNSSTRTDTCSGTIIYPGAVLTAAHCVTPTSPSDAGADWAVDRILVMKSNSETTAAASDYRQSLHAYLYNRPFVGSYKTNAVPGVDLAILGLKTRAAPSRPPAYFGGGTVNSLVTITGFGLNQTFDGSSGLGAKRYGLNSVYSSVLVGQSAGNGLTYGEGSSVLSWTSSSSSNAYQGNYYGDSGAPVYLGNCGPNNCTTISAIVSGGFTSQPYSQPYRTNGPNLADQNMASWVNSTAVRAFNAAAPE